MKKVSFVLFCVFIVIVLRPALLQFNEFLDKNEPIRETVEVIAKGLYYQPFRVDYLDARSEKVGAVIRVPVLIKRAAETAVGDRIEVVIGRGLFCRRWVTTEDKYLEYHGGAFRIVYLSFFSAIVLMFVAYYLFITRKISRRVRFSILSGLVVASFASLYLI